jgi:ATP-binding cassette subfamily A (ABC1) protein 3
MFTELKALLHRYYVTYFRFPGRFIRDFLLAIVIALALILRGNDALTVFGAILFVVTVPFTFLVPVRSMLGEIVAEKSSGSKEYLKLNGLSSLCYQFYAIIITSIKTIFFTIFVVIGLCFSPIFKDNWITKAQMTMLETLGLYCVCAAATIAFILLMSTFFSDPKVATSMGGLLYAAISLGSLVVLTLDNAVYYIIVCLFPQSALTLCLMNGFLRVKWPDGIDRNTVLMILGIETFVYLILYMYFDRVFQDENGAGQGYFFCLKRKQRRPVAPTTQNDLSQGLVNDNSCTVQDQEPDTSSALFHEAVYGANHLQKVVELQDVRKKFGDVHAVDGVSFSIYKGEIFCLLGHNGAGKTTLIKMLTGLVDIEKGKVSYDGKDFEENFEEIRNQIGICSQQDVLFEKFKVHEHLEMVAKLRKVPFFDIPMVVEEALQRLNLNSERNKYSEELSGGNKRKLSLAMAVLGNTKVIFLDEPTSGMDPQNRRAMWYHLKQLKEQGMTILLTTHHLDEADELADRITIMSKGKLLALGTSEFFKKSFGVGYHLSLTPMYDKISSDAFYAIKPELKELVLRVIPTANFDEQTAADVLKCSLPFAAQKDFSGLFAELEKMENVRINVEMNTLEDTFVNIGLSEDRLLHGESAHTEINFNINPPTCLGDRPRYSFASQTMAIIKRRVFILIRSKRNLFIMLLPLILVLLSLLSSLGFRDARAQMAFLQIVVFFAYTLNTAVFCSLPVYEKEEKLKYLMDVMGLRNLPYWLGNFIVDGLAMTIINAVFFGIYAYFYSNLDYWHIDYVMTPVELIILGIPHGLALVTIGYAYSFMYKSALSAVKFFPLFYFFVLFTASMFCMASVRSDGLKSAVIVTFVALPCPTAGLYIAFSGLRQGSNAATFAIAFWIHTIFYFLLTLYLESRSLSANNTPVNTHGYIQDSQAMPVDVDDIVKERNQTIQATESPIKVLELGKVYENGYPAVRDVSFNVAPGQIFGLLGPNGAGKSSTFNILTAAIPKSRGSAKLLNQEINRNMPEVFENVGICPQFNGLWEFLTVKEHLALFGNLKGIKGDNLNQVVNYYLDVLQLREYANKQAGKLSGGNKRKLSVANAFIGSAYLLFLDEPSTGVDPLARRYLWNSIQQVLTMRQASIVLTTHSMTEAESLSHKIGILINGKFVCVAPTQALKDKHSQGYKITISLEGDAGDPSAKILEAFPNAVRINEASTIQQTYHIPFEGFKFSEAFGKLDGYKEKNLIKDFSIYNTTLEQVFIYFSKFQVTNGANN